MRRDRSSQTIREIEIFSDCGLLDKTASARRTSFLRISLVDSPADIVTKNVDRDIVTSTLSTSDFPTKAVALRARLQFIID